MRDSEFVKSTLNKMKSAITFCRSNEINLIIEAFANRYPFRLFEPAKDPTYTFYLPLKEKRGMYQIETSYNQPFYYDAQSVPLFGFDATSELKDKMRSEPFLMDYDAQTPAVQAAVDKLMKDMYLLKAMGNHMTLNDQNSVKHEYPEIGEFMNMVYEEKNRERDKQHRYWKETYDECIQILGENARG